MNGIRSQAVFGLLFLIASTTAGCNRELFIDRDTRSSQSLRYYDNDSASETTAARRQSVGMPFGMPQGSAAQ